MVCCRANFDMIRISDLRAIARSRLADAKTLHSHKRYDGAFYLCGYAVEIALKARVCRTLKWTGFPESLREFGDYRSFQTHKLLVLLRLSGIEDRIKNQYMADWSIASTWAPEARYNPVGGVTPLEAETMIKAAEVLLKVIL